MAMNSDDHIRLGNYVSHGIRMLLFISSTIASFDYHICKAINLRREFEANGETVDVYRIAWMKSITCL